MDFRYLSVGAKAFLSFQVLITFVFHSQDISTALFISEEFLVLVAFLYYLVCSDLRESNISCHRVVTSQAGMI